jgi:DNA-binding CsgD family transcriptional regulator
VLNNLGLDPTAETVYQTLLASPGWDVTDIAVRLGLPEREVKAAVGRLTGLRLLVPSREVDGGLRVAEPTVALRALLDDQRAEIATRQQQIAASEIAVAKMLAGYAERALPDEGNERILGLDAVQRRLEQLMRDARREICTLLPGGPQDGPTLDANRPLDEEVLRRGVAMRTVYLDSIRNDRMTLDYARWLVELGGEVRTVPVLPLHVLTIDGVHALVPLDPADPAVGARHLICPGTVAAITALFDLFWTASTPLGAAPQRDDNGITPAERELLRLLADGATDAVAARRLGVALRTERRMLESLTDRLGARSRFEAGAKAAQRGWL